MTAKYLKKNIKYFLTLTLLISIYELIRAIHLLNNGMIPVTWPETGIIPGIKFLRGELQNDFYSYGISKTPYIHSAYILNLFLPKNENQLITTFFIGCIFSKSITLSSISISIINSIRVLINKINENKFFLNNIIDKNFYLIAGFIIFILEYNGKLSYLLKGTIIASWYFPSGNGLYPHGFACLLIFLALSIELYEQLDSSNKRNKLLRVFFYSLYFLSIYIHPIIPIELIIILIIINLIKNPTNIRNLLNRKICSLIILWLIGTCIIIFSYKSDYINPSILFDIYIKERHSHHYLPSYYITNKSILSFIISILFITIIIFINKLINIPNSFRNYIVKILLVIFIFLISVNLTQYLGVELMKNGMFIKLGISRIGSVYHYFYILSICLLLIQFLIKFNLQNLFAFNLSKLRAKKCIPILSLVLLLLTLKTIDQSIVNIDKSPANQLKNLISNDYYLNKKEFILTTDLEEFIRYPRELSNLNIYSDNYFPFDVNSIEEWSKRKSKKQKIQKEINEKSYLDKNLLEKNIVVLSEKNIENLKPLKKLKIDKKEIYIYDLN